MDLKSAVDYSLPAVVTAASAYKWVVFRKSMRAWEDGTDDLAVGVVRGEDVDRLAAAARGLSQYPIRSNELDARVGLALLLFGLAILVPSAYWAAASPDLVPTLRLMIVVAFVSASARTVRRARSEVRRLVAKDVLES